ncbi:MAG TPA: hypothetical protein VNV82_23530 [Bryobacteraceae bacterium]|nr:hypothetical protein [Bryobacteraceae bacterium]
MSRRKAAKKKARSHAAHHLTELVSKQMGLTLSDAIISALEDKLKTIVNPSIARR